ncbi:ATP-binding protein [Thiocystis violascens]|uniref:histidine kinase n=1 Tax=Thiocystis violascens (strain ATCC 17096 / DSM 198 / 6111) TaxID=765911 RepID=I3YBB8_THIV6|nr:ATP-binding protein [Thiocystis violascens]AFL74286.1 PAS domain S-box [Thiocystis violascens DSM 198]
MLPILVTEQVIEHFARSRALEQERLGVLTTLSTLRARIEGMVNANLLMVRGLAAVISANPDIDQNEFARIAQGLVDERHALRNIAGAPDMVISLMYPLAGNESAMGLNYRTHPTQAPAALRVVETGQPVLAGPLPLLQGGMGIVAREPVFIPPTHVGGQPRFWGLVSSIFDVDLLYRQTGLLAAVSTLRLALRGTDGKGARGEVFFGDPGVYVQRPVMTDIVLPGGAWQLAATPKQGWGQPTRLLWLIRLLGLLCAFGAGVIAYLLARGSQALARSEVRLRTLLDTIPDLVWLKDADGFFLACNPRFEQCFGARESDILGKGDHDFVPAEQADFFLAKDRAAIAAGRPLANEEWLTFASDGYRGLFETLKTPVRDARGVIVGVLGIAHDISERKRAEDEIRQLNADLEDRVQVRTAELAAINKELETFTYSVSHDLKAPLRGIDGYSRLLLEDHGQQLNEEGRLFLDNVRRCVDQMSQLIEDLLAYSRMERRGVHDVTLDLASVAKRILAERRDDIQALGGSVTLDLAESLTARADPDGLSMVLRNLLDNALKFSRSGVPPCIAIEGATSEHGIILAIRDQGIGFDLQFHDRIFEIFQRLQRAEDYPGTGIGLAIVRKAMERMGGRVWAESAPGQGATFFLELPR